MIDIPYLSPSKFTKYLNCHKSFEYQYIKSEPEGPRSADLVFGSAMHATIADHKLHGTGLIDAWKEAYRAEVDKEPVDWRNETEAGLFNYGIKILSEKDVIEEIDRLSPQPIQGARIQNAITIHESFGKTIDYHDLAIEVPVVLEVPGVPLPIIGYVDMINDGMPIELKTSNKSKSQTWCDQQIQVTFYAAALNQMGLLKLPCMVGYTIFVKLKTPKAQVFYTERTIHDVLWLFGLVGELWQGMNAGVFPGTGVGTWKCDPKYCGFFGRCRGGIGEIK